MSPDEQFCQGCGANRDVELQVSMLEATQLGKARKWILGIGIWYLVSGFLMVAIMGKQLTPHGRNLILITNAGICVLHVGLWVWAKKAVFPAALVALVLFITVQLANAAIDPSNIYKGIVLKIVFIAILVKAVQAGYEVHKIRGQRA
jgi:uncharacterized membrane protein